MKFKIVPFKPATKDPLAAEHAQISTWVEKLHRSKIFNRPTVENTALGPFMDANPAQKLQYIRAVRVQSQYWCTALEAIYRKGPDEDARTRPLFLDGWIETWNRLDELDWLLLNLLSRALPLEIDDIMWLISRHDVSIPHLERYPNINAMKTIKTFIAKEATNPELYAALRKLGVRMESRVRSQSRPTNLDRNSTNKTLLKAMSEILEQIGPGDEVAVVAESPVSRNSSPIEPANAGTPFLFHRLKRFLGMIPDEPPGESVTVGPDQFQMPAQSPLKAQHEQLSEFMAEFYDQHGSSDLSKYKAFRHIKQISPHERGLILLAAAERHLEPEIPGATRAADDRFRSYYFTRVDLVLAKTPISFDRDHLFDLLLYLAMTAYGNRVFEDDAFSEMLSQLEDEAAKSPFTEGERYILASLRTARVDAPLLGIARDDITRLNRLIGNDAQYYLSPGEDWTDTINADVSAQPADVRKLWGQLLRHAVGATSARPSAKWVKSARSSLQDLGDDVVLAAMERWLPLVGKGSTSWVRRLAPLGSEIRDTINPQNADTLRGLIWIASMLPGRAKLLRTFGAIALYSFKKIPGVGPRLPKIGNAAIYAISEIGTVEAVGQLAMLKVRVKFIPAQKEIEKAFQALAAELKLPRDEIEEMGVPTYGLEEVGLLREQFGDYRAELRVEGSDAAIHWFDAAGKELKSVPAKVKSDHKEEYKELQQSLKDIQGMLPAQRDRIDSMFLAQMSWPIETWRERYLDHALVGTIVRRLIWCVDGDGAFFVEGKPLDAKGKPVDHGKTAEITLWHPIGKSLEEIAAWRSFLEERKIVQSFKQAHREVYLLTDAERRTNTYSNRFAAHVLRQHQFNALCGARGWRNKLRLMVDDTYPPATRELTKWNLRAEFWFEGIGGEYGVDTNEAGVFLRLSTDQVRFYNVQAPVHESQSGEGAYRISYRDRGSDVPDEPIPLDQIPPLVLSEVMRDVDLFVGVSSVGNDPTWNDGGPEGRFRDYWQEYSFGALSGSASSRKEVLERLVPRLKIADRCSFSERFLVVRGEKRTYKIHLGSGNILMEPNDQYLCIVPDAKTRAACGDLHLPFEGDNVLSIILSKAFLLADDKKIKDPTITRQIDGK